MAGSVFNEPFGVVIELEKESEVDDLGDFGLTDFWYHADFLEGNYIYHVLVELLLLTLLYYQLFPGSIASSGVALGFMMAHKLRT